MNKLGANDKFRLIWRSLWIQILLNYKTMQGGGYLFILWPWLRNSEHREKQVKRTSGFLNGHPAFSAFALGAMLKRLSSGDTEDNPDEFDKWRESLAGPLGMVGDSLIWERWKPAVLALGVCFAIFNLFLNVIPNRTASIALPIALILIYNIPLFWLRWWALDAGFEKGKDVLQLGSHPMLLPLRANLDRLSGIAAACIAALAVMLLVMSFAWVGFAAGLLLTLILMQVRIPPVPSILLALLAAVLIKMFI